MTSVKENDVVKVHYTGKLPDGRVFDSSTEREPLQFKVGEGRLIPGFEDAVVGMQEKESKTVTIPHKEAYGDRHDELIQDVSKKQLPENINPEVGMELVSRTKEGQEQVVKVVDVKDEAITIDANHPLAGQDLVFEIEVLDIK